MMRALPPCLFNRGQRGRNCLFIQYQTVGDFMVYQNRLEKMLLQIFAHPENQKFFHILLIFLRSTMLLHRKKHIGNGFLFFISINCPKVFH